MKLKRIISLTVCIIAACSAARAQTETLDIATFTPPAGWKKQAKEGAALYADSTPKGYCLIAVYQSKKSSGNLEADFQSEWQELIVKPFRVTTQPAVQPGEESDGWKILAGTATFENEGVPTVALLTTSSGYGRTVSIVVLLSNQEYMPAIEAFLNSVKFTRPAVNNSRISTPAGSAPAKSGGASGISLSTTNFEDGWTATIHDDYVLVSKGGTNVHLFYAVELNDQSRNDTAQYFWNTVVLPRYNVQSATPWPGPSYEFIYFIEGSATDKRTGQSHYVAMRVVTVSGTAKVIVAAAPDKQSYSAAFPHPDKLSEMLNANRFAVTKQDLVGYWKGGFGGAVQLYNVYTGANAGVSTAAGSEEFTFDASGNYQSRLAGASGQVGSMKFYDAKYSGRFSVTNWEATLSNFNERATTGFDAYFEAVKGGRILHLTDKAAKGIQYHLVKVK